MLPRENRSTSECRYHDRGQEEEEESSLLSADGGGELSPYACFGVGTCQCQGASSLRNSDFVCFRQPNQGYSQATKARGHYRGSRGNQRSVIKSQQIHQPHLAHHPSQINGNFEKLQKEREIIQRQDRLVKNLMELQQSDAIFRQNVADSESKSEDCGLGSTLDYAVPHILQESSVPICIRRESDVHGGYYSKMHREREDKVEENALPPYNLMKERKETGSQSNMATALHEIRNSYNERLQRFDLESDKRKTTLQNRIQIMERYIGDINEQNDLLMEALQGLEKEARGKVMDLEKGLKKTTECVKNFKDKASQNVIKYADMYTLFVNKTEILESQLQWLITENYELKTERENLKKENAKNMEDAARLRKDIEQMIKIILKFMNTGYWQVENQDFYFENAKCGELFETLQHLVSKMKYLKKEHSEESDSLTTVYERENMFSKEIHVEKLQKENNLLKQKITELEKQYEEKVSDYQQLFNKVSNLEMEHSKEKGAWIEMKVDEKLPRNLENENFQPDADQTDLEKENMLLKAKSENILLKLKQLISQNVNTNCNLQTKEEICSLQEDLLESQMLHSTTYRELIKCEKDVDTLKEENSWLNANRQKSDQKFSELSKQFLELQDMLMSIKNIQQQDQQEIIRDLYLL